MFLLTMIGVKQQRKHVHNHSYYWLGCNIQVAAPTNVQVPETVVANLLPNHQTLSSTRVVRTFHGKPDMAPLFGLNSNTNAASNIEHFAKK